MSNKPSKYGMSRYLLKLLQLFLRLVYLVLVIIEKLKELFL